MEAVWQIVALGLLGAVLAALLKKHTPELALLLAVAVCGAAALDADRAVVLYWELETIGNANHKDRGTSNVQKHRI